MNLAVTTATESGMSNANVPQFLVIPVGIVTSDIVEF